MITVSPSSLKQLDVCARKRAFLYCMHLRGKSGNLNLALGSAFHLFAARYYAEGGFTFPSDEGMQAWFDTQNLFEKKLKEIGDLNEEYVEKARATLEKICFRYPVLAADLDRQLELKTFAVETTFTVPLTDKTSLIGQIDLVADSKWGMLVIDHKTAASARTAYFSNFKYDPQAVLYPWAAKELGLDVQSFMLNVIAKTQEPYIARERVILEWDRIEKTVDGIKEELKVQIEPLPTTLEEIRELPPSYLSCRSCGFKDLCHSPLEYAEFTLNSTFTQGSHLHNKAKEEEKK